MQSDWFDQLLQKLEIYNKKCEGGDDSLRASRENSPSRQGRLVTVNTDELRT
jgi:hypothetical protein